MSRSVEIPDDELVFTFSRSGGKGGQNVNKVSSKVTLRWNFNHSRGITPAEKGLLNRSSLVTHRLDSFGQLVITEEGERSQGANRKRAVKRLLHLVAQALIPPKKRIKTKPSRGAKERRLREKSLRTFQKRERRWKSSGDDR